MAALWHAQTCTHPAWVDFALTAAAAHANRSQHMQSCWVLSVQVQPNVRAQEAQRAGQ